MSRRFFLPELQLGTVELTDDQAHHLRNVMRARPGDQVELFDGLGQSASASITEIGRSRILLEAAHPQPDSRELGRELTVAMPLPKPDRIRFLLEKLTELGVREFIPLQTQHSEFEKKRVATGKMQQYVIEACKQCGRNELLKLSDVRTINELAAAAAETTHRIFADFSGKPFDHIAPSADPDSKGWSILVGPEGGLSEQEMELLRETGWTAVHLGPTILRMETAAIACASMLRLG